MLSAGHIANRRKFAPGVSEVFAAIQRRWLGPGEQHHLIAATLRRDRIYVRSIQTFAALPPAAAPILAGPQATAAMRSCEQTPGNWLVQQAADVAIGERRFALLPSRPRPLALKRMDTSERRNHQTLHRTVGPRFDASVRRKACDHILAPE
jgi:hypothetical protein